jgi:hypothetical protein
LEASKEPALNLPGVHAAIAPEEKDKKSIAFNI